MTIFIAVPLGLILLISLYLASLSFKTRENRIKPPAERHLSSCPDKPNCVSSKFTSDKTHAIDPFPLIDGNINKSREKLVDVIRQTGGDILVNDEHYIHAVFTSSIFRFKDDFEAKINDATIDIRSASRAGTSDLGKNRKRVEKLRSLYR